MPRYLFPGPDKSELILLKRKTHYQLILKTADGIITEGQWLLHMKISPEMCAFDGKYFVYHYMNLHDHRSYTVLSEAPYFTALMLWSECGKWGGGGELKNGKLVICPRTYKNFIRGELPKDLTLELRVPVYQKPIMLQGEGEFAGNVFKPLAFSPVETVLPLQV